MNATHRAALYRIKTQAVAKGINCDALDELLAGLDDRGFFKDEAFIWICDDLAGMDMARLGCTPEEAFWAGIAAIGGRMPVHAA